MSAPKAEAAGLTVERREELRRLAEMIDERMNLHAQSHRNSNSPNVFYCSPGCVSQQLRLVVEDVFGRVLAAAEAERDEARAAVERVRALADEWDRELESGAIRDQAARYCWTLAVHEIRHALDTVTSEDA